MMMAVARGGSCDWRLMEDCLMGGVYIRRNLCSTFCQCRRW
uniref:Uncharacterized protein n=1 Tax=Arundo donax TaxID=35708 RepID=A0A0A9AH63_ARUDO